MAILAGVIRFIGKLGGKRHYRNLHDKEIYASEIGGVSKEVYEKSENFVNNRLINDEMSGCALAVKSIRRGFQLLIPEMVDSRFNERLMKLVRNLSLKDVNGKKGTRSLRFSDNRESMRSLYFTTKRKAIDWAMMHAMSSHSDSRLETTLDMRNLVMRSSDAPGGAKTFRILSHLSIVSDYHYSKNLKRYEPGNPVNGLTSYAYSGFGSIGAAFSTQLKVAFPEGTVVGEDCTVIHCVAVEFFEPNGSNGDRPLYAPSLAMMDVF